MDNTNTLGTILIVAIIAILTGGLIIFSKGLLIAVIVFLACVAIWRYLRKHFDLWQCNLIILLSGYFLLTRGFSYIGIHVKDFYIFIGEIVMGISLISYNFRPTIAKLFSNSISKWMIAWILLGFILVIVNLTQSQYRLISIVRDFAMIYYSIFLLFGYAFYKNYKNLEIFYKIIGWVFILHAIWGLFYMAEETIVRNSPLLMGFMPLFSFRGDADSLIFLGGALYFLLMARQYKWPKSLAFLTVIVQLFLILVFQGRAIYVSCFFVFLFLFIAGVKKIFFKIIILFILIFSAWIVSNFEMKAKSIGDHDVSVEGTLQEFASIFKPDESGTARFRLVWWRFVIEQALKDPNLLLFGKGFGPSLAIDSSYMIVGNTVRKNEEIGGIAKSPHNFLITLFGRMGITGVFLWLVFNCLFFLHMLKGIRISRLLYEHKIHNILVWIACFILAIIGTSLFAVLLEAPFMAIPYFFFMGLGIAIVDKLKERVSLNAHTSNP